MVQGLSQNERQSNLHGIMLDSANTFASCFSKDK